MTGLPFARRTHGVGPSMPRPEHGGLISFEDGYAYPGGLPDLGDIAATAARAFRPETLQYAPRVGLPELREWIASYLRAEGTQVTGESVLIVNGAKQGIDLACKLFLDPGDAVVVTRPNYHSALNIFRGWDVELVEVGLDDEGLDVAELETRLHARAKGGQRTPKLLYVVPEFHNPTGVTTSRRRREAILHLAERYGILIVEDDPYRRIRFEGAAVPPLQVLDPTRVIGLGTFSKLLAPGLRIGWVAAAPDVVRRMAALKADGGSCPLTQRMILEYCRAGRFEPHVRQMTETYARHRDAMTTALRAEVPEAIFATPSGGYYLWLRLPEVVDSDRLLDDAKRLGVDFLPGSRFYATPGPKNVLRLAYSYASPDDITEGVRRLGEALRASA
jgi:2-aminoadipate transaminase